MARPIIFAFALATLSALPAFTQVDASIRNTYIAAPASVGEYDSQQEQAPIERAPAVVRNRPVYASAPRITSTLIAAGVWLRKEGGSQVEIVSQNKNFVEVRITRGRANVTVDHPAQDTQILVDLPGGQTALVKDGVYTFNAERDTVHVLEGQAEAFPGNREGDGVKLKENRMYAFGSGDAHAELFEPTTPDTDLLAGSYPGSEAGYDRRVGYSGGGELLYAGGPYYPGGFAPGFATYYGWGGPYGYGYPYGFGWGGWGYGGYPIGIGLGFGYGGGYYGGYRGGFGGFRGGFGGYRGGGFGRGGFRR